MLGIIYLALAIFVGFHFLEKFLPGLVKISKSKSLFGKTFKLSSWMITLPASFLVGTLAITWLTYMVSWCFASLFPQTKKPLLIGDIVIFAVFALISVFIFIKKKNDFKEFFNKIKKINMNQFNQFIIEHALELAFVLIVTVLWSVFMFRSFYVDGSMMHFGTTVFSDFGAHIPMIRSFSLGSNIPTEYPHFANSTADSLTGNNVRYHFMFQFLTGNLEYLGLRIDWAFNLPSILAIVSFLMLLYSFTVMLLGKRMAAIFATIFFFLRSSFAFFTYAAGLNLDANLSDAAKTSLIKYPLMLKQLISSIFDNTGNIGKTAHEDWGFYAQKVYVNKRHYAFALGISILVLIILYPLFKKMMVALKNVASKALEEIKKKASQSSASEEAQVQNTTQSDFKTRLNIWMREFFLSKDAWLPKDLKRAIIAGILLGLIGFWNGAVVIATLPVLFFMAICSKHRLEYLTTAVITVLLVLLQVNFFTSGDSADKMALNIGYLATFPDGINSIATNALSTHDFGTFLGQMPQVSYYILLFYMELLGFLPLLLLANLSVSPKGLRWLTLAFLSPLLVATLVQFTIDIGANHVIIIYSVILMNIILANLLRKLFVSKKILLPVIVFVLSEIYLYLSAKTFKFDSIFLPINIFVLAVITIVLIVCLVIRRFDYRRFISISVAVVLFIALISSGIVDGFSLYNLDKNSGRVYDLNDPITRWIEDNTNANAVFLIHPEFIHQALIAGRKVFNGGNYFVWSAGYDFDGRNVIVKQIYSAQNKDMLTELIKDNKIDYICVSNENRNAEDYVLNEQLIKDTYKLAFKDPNSDTEIYSTK